MSGAPTTEGSAKPTGSLWRDRNFMLFWTGETLSLFGAQITTLALPLTAVLEFDAGPGDLGLLGLARWGPYVVLALLFGVWVDRSRRRPLMIGANAARMVLIAMVPLLAAVDLLDSPTLILITLGVGVASVLFDVSWMSYVPTLVRGSDRLVEANSKLGATSAASDTAGPALGGVLVSALTAPITLVLDALSYLVSVVSLLMIRVREPKPEPKPDRKLLTELREGLRWVVGNRYLRAIALVGCFCNFFTMGTTTLFLLYALQDKGISPGLLGVILSLGAIGGIIGASFSARLLRGLGVGRTYTVSVSVTFLGMVLVPIVGGPLPVAVAGFVIAFFLVYVGMSVANVVIVTLRQTITPHALMGRMTAAMRTLMFSGGSLGAPAAGLLGEAIGLHAALWAIAAGSGLMIAAVAMSPVGKLTEMPPAVE